jgi:Alternative complex III, ActD subunit
MSDRAPRPASVPAKPYGVMAEFATPRDILHAAGTLRAQGYSKVEAFTPFPVHGLDVALGHPGSKVPWIVLGGAAFGASFGLWLQWWTSAVNYPIRIDGKPFFSLPAFVPITFELGVLCSAFAALFGMLILNGLPRPFHPVFTHTRFHRATDDRFFLAIEADDPRFDVQRAERDLAGAGGTNVEVLEA